MEPLIWIGLVGGTLFLIWYGYGLLVRRPSEGEMPAGEGNGRCHLCRREFPLGEMVTREKAAGFENHFCGDCIEELYRDYTERRGRTRPTTALPGRN